MSKNLNFFVKNSYIRIKLSNYEPIFRATRFSWPFFICRVLSLFSTKDILFLSIESLLSLLNKVAFYGKPIMMGSDYDGVL